MASCEERAAIGRWFCPRRQAAEGWGKFPPAPRTKRGSGPSDGGLKPALLRRDGTGQNEILEPFPQHGLENFAGGCVRNLADHNDLIGNPPATDLPLHAHDRFCPGHTL